MRMFVWWSKTDKTPNQRFRFDRRPPSRSRWCFCYLRAFCVSFAHRSPQLDFGETYIGTIESGFHLSLQSILLISLQLLLFTAWRPLLLRFGQWRQRPWRIWEWNWCLTGFGHWPDNLQLMLPRHCWSDKVWSTGFRAPGAANKQLRASTVDWWRILGKS